MNRALCVLVGEIARWIGNRLIRAGRWLTTEFPSQEEIQLRELFGESPEPNRCAQHGVRRS